MARAKCSKCGASAIDDTFEQARKKLDHSVGLSRGIKCGDTYGRVYEIGKPQIKAPQKTIIKTESIEESEKTLEEPKKEKKSKKFKIRK